MFKKDFFVSTIVFVYMLFALVFINEGVTLYYHVIDAVFLLNFLFSFFILRNLKIEMSIYVKVISLFTFYLLISHFWSPVSSETFKLNLLLQSSLVINGFVLFVMFRNYNLIKTIGYVYLSYIVLNFLVFIDVLSSDFFSPLTTEEELLYMTRFRGVSSNPNIMAMELFFASVVLLYLQKTNTIKNNIIKKITPIMLIIIFIMLLSSGSKKGIIAFSLFISFYFYSGKKKKNLKFLLSRILLVCSPFILFYIYIYFLKDSIVFERIFLALEVIVSGKGDDESTQERLRLYKLAYEGILDYPILGSGTNSFAYYNYFYTHTNYLELLFNLGIIGFILYYRLYYKLIRLIKKSSELKQFGYFVMFVLLFIDFSLVSYNLRSYMIFFTFINVIFLEETNEKEVTLYK